MTDQEIYTPYPIDIENYNPKDLKEQLKSPAQEVRTKAIKELIQYACIQEDTNKSSIAIDALVDVVTNRDQLKQDRIQAAQGIEQLIISLLTRDEDHQDTFQKITNKISQAILDPEETDRDILAEMTQGIANYYIFKNQEIPTRPETDFIRFDNFDLSQAEYKVHFLDNNNKEVEVVYCFAVPINITQLLLHRYPTKQGKILQQQAFIGAQKYAIAWEVADDIARSGDNGQKLTLEPYDASKHRISYQTETEGERESQFVDDYDPSLDFKSTIILPYDKYEVVIPLNKEQTIHGYKVLPRNSIST